MSMANGSSCVEKKHSRLGCTAVGRQKPARRAQIALDRTAPIAAAHARTATRPLRLNVRSVFAMLL